MGISKKNLENELKKIFINKEKLSIRNYRGRFERIATIILFDEIVKRGWTDSLFESMQSAIFGYNFDNMINVCRKVERYDIARIYQYIKEKEF